MEELELRTIDTQMQRLQADKQAVRDQIDELTARLMKPIIDGRGAFQRAVEDGDMASVAYDTKSEIREELAYLEQREAFLNEAIEDGSLARDKAHGQASKLACQAKRPAYVEQAKQLILALREVAKCNRQLQRIRHEIEAEGFRTDSLPNAQIDLGGWNNPFGGLLTYHCRRVARVFPELKQLAMSDL